jgi:hypothetical protein
MKCRTIHGPVIAISGGLLPGLLLEGCKLLQWPWIFSHSGGGREGEGRGRRRWRRRRGLSSHLLPDAGLKDRGRDREGQPWLKKTRDIIAARLAIIVKIKFISAGHLAYLSSLFTYSLVLK